MFIPIVSIRDIRFVILHSIPAPSTSLSVLTIHTMGVYGLWAWMHKKEAPFSPQMGVPTCINCTRLMHDAHTLHVDLLGAYYPTIQRAYSAQTEEIAHKIVKSAVCAIGNVEC